MENIGIKTPPIVIKPVVSVSNATPVAQKPEVSFVQIGGGADGALFDPILAEQQRFQAVQRAARQVADFYVVSDRTFTIFKDVTGQYVTRFTSLRDGKVTYIPEPNLVRIGGESDKVSVDVRA